MVKQTVVSSTIEHAWKPGRNENELAMHVDMDQPQNNVSIKKCKRFGIVAYHYTHTHLHTCAQNNTVLILDVNICNKSIKIWTGIIITSKSG